MTETLYVALDSGGVEHAPAGDITWVVPHGSEPEVTDVGRDLTLCSPAALLEVLEERIYRVEPMGDAHPGDGGTVITSSARIVGATAWATQSAARFALQCAGHVLGQTADVKMPDGTPLGQALADAQALLDGTAEGSLDHIGRLARLSALRRLKHERAELTRLLIGLELDDEARDVNALDDPAYATAQPIIDAVLAAIEAVRHHLLPHLYADVTEGADEVEEATNLDRPTAAGAPTIIYTPIGPVSTSAQKVLNHEPAWTGAREAARHARLAIKDRDGDDAEAEELAWQATALAAVLEGS